MGSPMTRLRAAKAAAFLATVAFACLLLAAPAFARPDGVTPQAKALRDVATQTITDMAGRTVTIPVKIHKVYGTSPVASIMVYTLNPKQLMAWNYAQTWLEKKYLVRSARYLPNMGGWQAGGTPNLEAVIAAKPDFILDMTTTTPATDASNISRVNKLQAQLKIPFVIIDGRFEEMASSYIWLGKLLGDQKIAATEAKYVNNVLSYVDKHAAKIPAAKQKTVYYAEGTAGLNTEPSTSQHARILNEIHATNVAASVPLGSGAGMTPVSMEQVLAWNPSWVLVGISLTGNSPTGANAYTAIKAGENGWSAIAAVQNKHVYSIPLLPFAWFDRPPGVNQILGMIWASQLIYPEYYHYDLVKETKRFFKLFYHVDVSTAQLRKDVLATSIAWK